jgi:hypothetical protein
VEKNRLSVVTVLGNSMKSDTIVNGGMAEWFKAAVLKTVDGETRPGVRIPLPPPLQFMCRMYLQELTSNCREFALQFGACATFS